MERPRDDHKLTHNVRLATRDRLFGGTVSRLQVAELIAAAVASPELAENKVLEVVSETSAPALSYEDLLAAVNIERPFSESLLREVLEANENVSGDDANGYTYAKAA